MTRLLALLYALLAYGVFFLVFLWFVAFVGDIRGVAGIVDIPATVDYNPRIGDGMGPAIVVNLALIAIFGLHHTIAARMGVKEKLTKAVPKSVERSTYVLVASLLLAVLMHWWHPMEGSLWNLEGSVLGRLTRAPTCDAPSRDTGGREACCPLGPVWVVFRCRGAAISGQTFDRRACFSQHWPLSSSV